MALAFLGVGYGWLPSNISFVRFLGRFFLHGGGLIYWLPAWPSSQAPWLVGWPPSLCLGSTRTRQTGVKVGTRGSEVGVGVFS